MKGSSRRGMLRGYTLCLGLVLGISFSRKFTSASLKGFKASSFRTRSYAINRGLDIRVGNHRKQRVRAMRFPVVGFVNEDMDSEAGDLVNLNMSAEIRSKRGNLTELWNTIMKPYATGMDSDDANKGKRLLGMLPESNHTPEATAALLLSNRTWDDETYTQLTSGVPEQVLNIQGSIAHTTASLISHTRNGTLIEHLVSSASAKFSALSGNIEALPSEFLQKYPLETQKVVEEKSNRPSMLSRGIEGVKVRIENVKDSIVASKERILAKGAAMWQSNIDSMQQLFDLDQEKSYDAYRDGRKRYNEFPRDSSFVSSTDTDDFAYSGDISGPVPLDTSKYMMRAPTPESQGPDWIGFAKADAHMGARTPF